MDNEMQQTNPIWYKELQYKDVKVYIRDNINSASRSFVAIGYYLKYVRDNELFKEDGYQSIWEFAQGEFSIGKSSASRFMAINDRFSNDGNSPILLEQYKDFSSSKLSEMLTMTDDQLEQVSVTTTRAEIREMKQPAKEEVVAPAQQKTEPKKPYYECAAYLQYQHTSGCKDCFYDKTDCPYDRIGYFEELKRKEEWLIHCEVLKEMCDSLCKMGSYVLENSNYNMETIKSLSRKDQDFSFGFGNDGSGHSKYDSEYKAKTNRYHVKEFNGSGKWMFEAGEVDQQIWNYNGNTWRFKQHEAKKLSKSIDDLDFTVNTYNCLRRSSIDTIDELCSLTEDDVISIRNISRKCLDEIKLKLSEIGRELKIEDIPETVNDDPEIVDNEPEIENDKCIHNKDYQCDVPAELKIVTGPGEECFSEDEEESTACCWDCPKHGNCGYECNSSMNRKPDPVEIVEADIIETEYEDDNDDEDEPEIIDPEYYTYRDVDDELDKLMGYVETFRKDNDNSSGRRKAKMRLDAIILLDRDMRKVPVVEETEPEQPELPILRNNDQRKEFIEAYDTWPIWIDTEPTGERYYRYDFDNSESFVIRVSLCRKYLGWDKGYSKDLVYGREEYFILKKDLPFVESGASKSMMIDYLKDFQKKGG